MFRELRGLVSQGGAAFRTIPPNPPRSQARKGFNAVALRIALRVVLLVALLVTSPFMSGCSDFFDDLNRPNYHPTHTKVAENAWSNNNRFYVEVPEDQPVHIDAWSSDGRHVETDGQREATLTIPDGTWTIEYKVGGYKWESFSGIMIDTAPPTITGLEMIANAEDSRRYTLGVGAVVAGATSLKVLSLQDGSVVATSLPVALQNLVDGLSVFVVSARDQAGNYVNVTVQVRFGSAVDLPEGKYTFGIVARYSNNLILWDIEKPGRYLTPAQASQQLGGQYLGSGYGVAPEDAEVKRIAAQVVAPDMTTTEGALALLKYMMQNLHYDTSRLDNDHLLTPRQVLLDLEDAAGRDCTDKTGKAADCDGLVMDGAGNGVRGGICRDLAATYVSLLRAAGIPARLVSGYVAGNVNGFHAWVEFYAGTPTAYPNQSPWIPVDVSNLDGTYREATLLQSFGIQLPEYLTLRAVPEASEVRGWSTAIGVHYLYPDRADEPVITFQKSVASTFTRTGVLCFDPQTRARTTADSENACAAFGFYLPKFTLATTRIIDYGILVETAPAGTSVKAEVGYPFPESVKPNQVDFEFYGPLAGTDVAAGKATANFKT